MRSTRPLAAALAFVLAAAALPGIVPPGSEPARSAEAGAAQPVTAAAMPSVDLSPIVGTSGNLRAVIGLPTSLAADDHLAPLLAGRSIEDPGVHPLGLAAPDGDSLVAVSMLPFEGGTRTGLSYRTGSWPKTALPAKDPPRPPSRSVSASPTSSPTTSRASGPRCSSSARS